MERVFTFGDDESLVAVTDGFWKWIGHKVILRVAWGCGPNEGNAITVPDVTMASMYAIYLRRMRIPHTYVDVETPTILP